MLSARKKLVLTSAAAAVAMLLVVTVVVAGYRLLYPPSVYGTCNALTERCHDVPLATAEMVAGYMWPSDSKVIQSSATLPGIVGLSGGPAYVEAMVLLGGGATSISMGNGYTTTNPNATHPISTETGCRAMHLDGVTGIRVIRNQENLVVLKGMKNRSTVIHVSSNYAHG